MILRLKFVSTNETFYNINNLLIEGHACFQVHPSLLRCMTNSKENDRLYSID